MSTTTVDSTRARSFPVARLATATFVAAVAAAAANSVVGVATMAVSDAPDSFMPLSVGAPITASVVVAIAAALVFAVVWRLTRRPVRVFTRVSLAVLVVSFAPLVGLATQDQPEPEMAGADAAALIGLGVMHVVAYLAIVPTLVRLSKARDEESSDQAAQNRGAR